MCASRFQRTLRETGATRAACAAQNRARQLRVKRVCSEIAALGFPPSAGVAPDPMKSGQPRAQLTVRAAFGYSRANLGSTRTLRGRSAQGARIVRPSIGGASGHIRHECGRRARRGRLFGRGRLLGWTCDIGGLGAVPPCRQPHRSRRHRAPKAPAEDLIRPRRPILSDCLVCSMS